MIILSLRPHLNQTAQKSTLNMTNLSLLTGYRFICTVTTCLKLFQPGFGVCDIKVTYDGLASDNGLVS